MRSTLWITCLLLAGCLGNQGGADDSTRPAGSPENDSTAVSALANAQRNLIDGAIGMLRRYEYVREREVSVTDESGNQVLRRMHTTRFYGPPDDRQAEIRDSSSAGMQGADFWAEYAAAPSIEDTVDWSRRLLEDDPVVLSRQGIAYYKYSTLTDTTIGDSRIMRVESTVLPDAERSGIQSARFYIEPETNEIVGFELEFAQRSLLFDEWSRFRYMLGPGRDGSWIPSAVTVRTFLNLPLSKGQHFHLTITYLPAK